MGWYVILLLLYSIENSLSSQIMHMYFQCPVKAMDTCPPEPFEMRFTFAAGCIMGELLKHAPLFPGRTEISMLDMFTELLGSPQEVYKVQSASAPPQGS